MGTVIYFDTLFLEEPTSVVNGTVDGLHCMRLSTRVSTLWRRFYWIMEPILPVPIKRVKLFLSRPSYGIVSPGHFHDGNSFINKETKEITGSLFYAADIVRLLLDYGVDIYDPAKKPALLVAVKASRTNAVNVLLESGIDFNSADEGRKRSLDLSLESGLSEIIRILATHGASPGLKWEKSSYHISQWKEEVWYPGL
jgi:hypothetical protein